MINDLLTIVMTYVNKSNILKLRKVNKKLKTLVYKFGKPIIKSFTSKVSNYSIKICKKVKLDICYDMPRDNINYKNNIYKGFFNCNYEDVINIDKYKNLTKLYLYGNPHIMYNSIKYLKNLTHLTIFNCESITDGVIRNLKTLTSLEIRGKNSITDNGIKSLKNLTELDIGKNSITDNGIKSLKNLTELDISSNNLITNTGIKSLKKLTKLSLNYNTLITDDGIKSLKKLTELSMNYSDLINPMGYCFIYSNMHGFSINSLKKHRVEKINMRW